MFIKLRSNFYNWLKRADRELTGLDKECNPSRRISVGNTRELDSDGMIFKVIGARGGVIVEIRKRDRGTGDYDLSIHIIPEGEELGEALAKIITLENLKY
jgi:hypothetical protein